MARLNPVWQIVAHKVEAAFAVSDGTFRLRGPPGRSGQSNVRDNTAGVLRSTGRVVAYCCF